MALIATSAALNALPASAATMTLTVNSTDWGGADAIPGDGNCRTGTGVCTLRAAIEESNALNAAAGAVTITVDPSIPIGTKMTGNNPNAYPAQKMDSTSYFSVYDVYGSVFVVNAPVTIDLGHRLVADASASDNYEGSVFYLNGPSINVYNADNVLSSGASFIVGPKANGIVIDGSQDGTRGNVATTANYHPERFFVLREGAQNVTLQHYDVSGFYDDVNTGGIFFFDAYRTTTVVPNKNIVVDDVDVRYSSSTTCTSTNGSGCRTRLTNWVGAANQNAARIAIEGLTFKNMTVMNMTGQYAFQMNGNDAGTAGTYSPTITDLTMVDNQFLNNNNYGSGEDYAFVSLPYGGNLKGTTTISRNVFTTTDTAEVAIYVNAASTPQAAGSTTPSNITISDNYFDGYSAAGVGGVRFYRTGIATFSHNRFGVRSGGSGTATEETSSSLVMFNNYDTTANQKINTWYPSSTAKLVSGDVPAGALTVTQELADPTAPVCDATVVVQRPTVAPIPTNPVTLDVYWTTRDDAELYLGSVSGVTGETATLKFSLPVGTQSPDGGQTSIMAVDGTTGATAQGNIRLQTQVEGYSQLMSSQYSRTVALESGNCKPVLTINQAAGQNDETMGRDLHFTITSTMPLDPATLTIADIGVTAEATANTIDATRLNPQVVSVTEVPGSNGKQFDVIIRVDDSAKVTATVAAETVASTSGLTNSGAATSTDDNITFVNPMTVAPPKFTLVTGEPNGKDYTIMIKAGAPETTADLNFVSTVTQPDGTPTVTPSTNTPVIATGATQSDPINVTAAAGEVTANTETTISHSVVTSEDTNYDGLLVPSVKPYLFSTDPTIKIEKRAWVAKEGMTLDGTSLETIWATGDMVPKDTRLTDRQTVCFIYTVSNTSTDDWGTSLKNITVTDSDERLGTDGVIGTILEIPQGGQPAGLFACTALVPVDTTTTDVVAGDGE